MLMQSSHEDFSGKHIIALPRVSIVIPTLNCATALEICLRSILSQDYPKEKIEIIVIDGGSSDDTPDIARSLGCKVMSNPRLRANQEARRFVGLKESIGDLVAFIDSDNVLPHELWLRKMVRPFLEDRGIFAAETLWYGYSRKFSALTRYFALVGAVDPVAIGLGKADRLPFAQTHWKSGSSIKIFPGYYRVEFHPRNLPTVGANGYIARRHVLLQSVSSHTEFFHIDINLDLVRAGYTTFAFVTDSIFHDTGNSLKHFLRRRVTYAFQLLFRQYSRRRYRIYDPRFDRGKLLKHMVLAFTLIHPTREAIKGYKFLPDPAWFLHPIVSISLTAIYCVCFATWLIETGGRDRQ